MASRTAVPAVAVPMVPLFSDPLKTVPEKLSRTSRRLGQRGSSTLFVGSGSTKASSAPRWLAERLPGVVAIPFSAQPLRRKQQLMTDMFVSERKKWSLEGWQLGWTASRNHAGTTWWHTKTINMSVRALQNNDLAFNKNMLLHELAHARAGRAEMHGPTWKRLAIEMGCDGKRLYDAKFGFAGGADDYLMWFLVCSGQCGTRYTGDFRHAKNRKMEGRSCGKDNCSGRFHYVRGGQLKRVKKMTMPLLKAECGKLGLTKSGKKQDLVDRILGSLGMQGLEEAQRIEKYLALAVARDAYARNTRHRTHAQRGALRVAGEKHLAGASSRDGLKSRCWRNASNDQTGPQPVQQRDDTKPGPSNAPAASVTALNSDNDEEPLLVPGVTIDCIDLCSSDEDTAKPYKGKGKRASAVQDENWFFPNCTVPTGAEALDLSAAPQHVGTLSERLKKRFRTAA